jgi:antitoxin component of RelBE/YafQ-DinJ toxin-antitoxin module
MPDYTLTLTDHQAALVTRAAAERATPVETLITDTVTEYISALDTRYRISDEKRLLELFRDADDARRIAAFTALAQE